MSDHSSSVFNNSCLRLPRNPKSDHPLPIYEQKYLNDLENAARKLTLEAQNNMKANKSNNNNPVNSFIEFYDSIPEYDDINHLSNTEFYKKIEMLKEKQKSYCDYVNNEKQTSEWLNNGFRETTNVETKKKSTIKPFCVTPILSKSPKFGKKDDFEINKPSSRRSVRIETPEESSPSDFYRRPKSRLPSASSRSREDWDDASTLEDYKLELGEPSSGRSKSAPNSPIKNKPSVGWKDSITIPKPFEITVRDDEGNIVEEISQSNRSKQDKPEMFKAHPIPIESQIPLFEKLMADQELKNHIVRERSKAALQSQMRPFSFTRRDEEIQEIQKLSKGLSVSSPSLFLDDPPIKIKKFKAKPIPKNLFSNYIYKKMHEDEFYRALQKKIRAEEMLRGASLPPSMAKRERTSHKYDVCPRSFRDLEPNKEELNITKKKALFDFGLYEKELEELKNEYLGISPKSYKCTRRSKRREKNKRNSSATSSDNSRTVSSLGLQSVNRSNLAAVLRIESAKKRQERELCLKLEDCKIKEESHWRKKLMRKKPVWSSLAYSHEEDLAMRLQLRREEEKLRSEEHKLRMHLMLGRVNQQPTLFERQSQVKYPKTKEELLDQLYTEYRSKREEKSLSDLSEMKDEGEVSSNSKESVGEEKEKCDNSTSTED